MAIQEGKAAPAFKLADADDQEVSLASFAGKNVIVYFYPKDDTPGCTKEACGFRDGWNDLKKAGAVVLGISADSGASHKKFAAKYKLPFTLLSDPDRKVMKSTGPGARRSSTGRRSSASSARPYGSDRTEK